MKRYFGCWHLFVENKNGGYFANYGSMFCCVKCGMKCTISFPFFRYLLGRVIIGKETFGYADKYPYVRCFEKELTFNTDWSNYKGYINRKGRYVEGIYKDET